MGTSIPSFTTYIFNPKTIHTESGKNFFETICKKRGDQDYSITFNENESVILYQTGNGNRIPNYGNG